MGGGTLSKLARLLQNQELELDFSKRELFLTLNQGRFALVHTSNFVPNRDGTYGCETLRILSPFSFFNTRFRYNEGVPKVCWKMAKHGLMAECPDEIDFLPRDTMRLME